MVDLLIYFVVFCILFVVAYFAITHLLPPPVQSVALVVLYVFAALCLCYLLLSLVGGAGGLPHWRR